MFPSGFSNLVHTLTLIDLVANALEAQALFAFTFREPPHDPALTETVVVPCPETIIQPVGACHV